MVYYYTSGNVKMLRNILLDYGAAKEVSPYEYMKTYIEKCPESTEDAKLSWIAETFLGIQKHLQFLKGITIHLSEELSKEDQDYFIIILYAVTFQIPPKDLHYLYKCLFNLSRPLLDTFTKFLSNNEVLAFISQVAQVDYDTNYITEKILSPLFQWQPYISEMAHNYAEYVRKVDNRKIKPPTIPIQPKVLNRKGKESLIFTEPTFPTTPPNSLRTKTKMLTKSAIDRRLNSIHEKNKQNANKLLNNVKHQNFHYAKTKSEEYYKRLSNIRDQVQNDNRLKKPFLKPKLVAKNPPLPVKETAATIKRMNKRIQISEQEEVKWLKAIMNDCRNTAKIEELEEFDRQEKERERLLGIEKKHLLGQISHEEALIAKKKLQEENKKKYEEFLKEKDSWNEQIENWKRSEMEKSRLNIEKLSMVELNVIEAKNSNLNKKKENAEKIKKETELLIVKAMKTKQEELERRIRMIKEIKILAMISKKAKVPKIIDLTETTGVGLLCEMSIAELQERLSAMKIGIKEELERKRTLIKDENLAAKQDLEEVKKTITNYLVERQNMRKQTKKSTLKSEPTPSKEISDLKRILEEKRRLRIKLSK